VIVDPGVDAASGVQDAVREHGLRPVAVLLTHGHIDHTWSVVPVCQSALAPAWIHSADRLMLADPMAGLSDGTRSAVLAMTGGALPAVEPSDVRELTDGAEMSLAGLAITVRHAPGHTSGSVVFEVPETDGPDHLVSGDVLFAGSIGRTDLPGGDHEAMLNSLSTVILPMRDETRVLPGHGPATSIGQERRSNPFLLALIESQGAYATPTEGGQ
jgi:hydroxyacylglutathione hydrolase